VASLLAGILLLTIGFGVGWIFSRSTPIPLVEITQQYGTLKVGKDAEHRCVERKDDRAVVCGRLRLPPDARVPELGVPVRGGYAEVPSDSSDGPEPSFLWMTQMQS
jgi:hypothetical protein